MTDVTIKAIYLGSHRELDTNESFLGAERISELIAKAYGSASDPLYNHLTEITLHDGNSDGVIPFHDRTPGTTEYIVVGGEKRSIDTGFVMNARLNYSDGTPGFNVTVRVIQDGQGNLYMVPPPQGASQAEIDAVTLKPIESIELRSVAQNNFGSLNVTRYGWPGGPVFPCFCAGTMIETPDGPRLVEDLRAGDLVLTRDNGAQPIGWIGRRDLPAEALAEIPALRPIRISQGALGAGLPAADLLVSPQHRVLVRSKIAQKMFGTTEVLVAAKQLCQIDGIDIADDMDSVTYVHFMFEAHQIVISNGAETESLYAGAEALKSVGPAAREEILTLFPELRDGAEYAPARPLTSGRLARKLAVRHAQNGKPLVA